MSDILNPNASVSIGLEGLAVVCFNRSYNENRGRWEIAIPRFDDHKLTIKISDLFTLVVEKEVNLIEIKDRGGVATKTTHEVGETFDRKQRDKNDKNDFRWVRAFTNGEVPPEPIAKEDRQVAVTMLYVYDALAYTKNIEHEAITLVQVEQEKTVPVRDGALDSRNPEAASALIQSADVGSETRTMGMDIQSPRGGAVDILFNGSVATTIPEGQSPLEVTIRNAEKPGAPSDERQLFTDDFEFALGDFYRYYQLFKVDGPKLHLWGRVPAGDGSGKNCCCNQVRVNLANLDAFS